MLLENPVTSSEGLSSRSREAIENAWLRVLQATRQEGVLPFELDSWEVRQIQIAADESDNPLAHEIFDALTLTVLFEDVNKRRKGRFDFPTVYSLLSGAEQLVEQLQMHIADSIKRNDFEAAKAVHRTTSRLRLALSVLRQHDLVPGRYRPETVKTRYGFLGAASVPEPTAAKKSRPAPVFFITMDAASARSASPYAIALIILVTFVAGLFGRRRESAEPPPLPKSSAVSFNPVPHEAFAAANLPVVAAAQSPRALQLVVDETWLSRPSDDRAAAIAQLASRLKDLKIERCEVVSTRGAPLASCGSSGCRPARAP